MRSARPVLFMLSLVLGYSLVKGPALPTHKVVTPQAADRTPSSFFSNNKCVAGVSGRSYFSLVEFRHSHREFTQIKGEVSEAQVRDAIRVPERFLALLEVLSARKTPKSFNFPRLVEQLPLKEQKKLYREIWKATRHGQITDFHLRKLLVKIYRVTHRPQGFWGAVWKNKGIRKAFKQLDDQKILERIEIDLFLQGAETSLQSIIRDPGLWTQFRQLLRKRRYWVDNSLALLFWGMSLSIAPPVLFDGTALGALPLAFYIPPYLPSFRQFLSQTWNPDVSRTVLQSGWGQGYQSLKTKMRVEESRIRKSNFFRGGYLSVVSILLATSLTIHHWPKIEQALANEFMGYKRQQLVEFLKEDLTPEQAGLKEYEAFIKHLEEIRSEPVDRNHPDVQAARQYYIDSAVTGAKNHEERWHSQ